MSCLTHHKSEARIARHAQFLACVEAHLLAGRPELLKLHYAVHDSQPPVPVFHHHAHQ